MSLRSIKALRYGARHINYVRNPWLHVFSETGGYECTTICHDGCNALCHESHFEPRSRSHDPFVCQSIQLNVLNVTPTQPKMKGPAKQQRPNAS